MSSIGHRCAESGVNTLKASAHLEEEEHKRIAKLVQHVQNRNVLDNGATQWHDHIHKFAFFNKTTRCWKNAWFTNLFRAEQILVLTVYLSLSMTALTTSFFPFCRASWRNDVSFLFKTISAPRLSMSLTAATCPPFAAMWSAVFWYINIRRQ